MRRQFRQFYSIAFRDTSFKPMETFQKMSALCRIESDTGLTQRGRLLRKMIPKIEKHMTGVYVIRCSSNGKNYVGSAARCFIERWQAHVGKLRRGKHHSRHLQFAWSKFGESSFTFEVLEYCDPSLCISREQFHIDRFMAADDRYGFNICKKAGSLLGHKHSAETKAKISAVHKGRKPSEETRAKLRARVWSQETIQKRRLKMLGRSPSQETRQKIREKNSGKKLTLEHREKLKAAKLGMTKSEETKLKGRITRRAKKEIFQRLLQFEPQKP